MRSFLNLVVLVASVALTSAAAGASEAASDHSLDPIRIPFEEAVMEPSGQHLRLRWKSDPGFPAFGGTTWKFWARPGGFFPANDFTLIAQTSGRTSANLEFGTSLDPLPDAGNVRVHYDDTTETITIDAYLEVKMGVEKVLYPREIAHVWVDPGFIRAYTAAGVPTNALYETEEIDNAQINTDRIGVVPYTNLFGDTTPQAALWCEAGVQQVLDGINELSRLSTFLDRSGRNLPNGHPLEAATDDQRPWFVPATTLGSRFGTARGAVSFNVLPSAGP